jgi:lipopolysaccharide export system permease protein
MAALKLPEIALRILPFGVLFAAIYSCWKLNRTQELVIMRSAGLSVWQFLSPMLAAAVILGAASTTLLNPVSAFMFDRYNQMENLYLKTNSNMVTISRSGIWLRQPVDDGYALLRAGSFDEKDWRFSDLTILFFAADDGFQKRLDAKTGYLKSGHWDLRHVIQNDDQGTNTLETLDLPTSLTVSKIEESFADPETLSFWRIPEYLKIMEDSGIPTARLHVYFHSLLAKPLMLVAMILLAATFSLRPTRFGGAAMLMALGIAAGFSIFFFESILQAFGFSQKIPALLAAWTPAFVGVLIGATALLYLEDG